MTRRAWPHFRDGWECSYCGHLLGIFRGPNMATGPWIRALRGWTVQDGGMRWSPPRRRATFPDVFLESPPTPFPVTCRNRDCGETVLIG